VGWPRSVTREWLLCRRLPYLQSFRNFKFKFLFLEQDMATK
jgi:hypothetical protein